MSAEQPPEVIQPAPVPYSVQVAKVGTTTLDSGDTVPLLRLVVFTASGQTFIFLKAPDALTLAELLREHAGGLTIAQTLDGLD